MKKVIKRIILILLAILIVFGIWRLSLFIRANLIESKIADVLDNDYYIKTTVITHSYTNGENTEREDIQEQWITEKYKKRKYYYKDTDGTEFSTEMWDNEEKNIFVTRNSDGDISVLYQRDNSYNILFGWNNNVDYIIYWEFDKIGDVLNSAGVSAFLEYIFVEPFNSIKSVKTEFIDDTECYAIETEWQTIYVAKDTYIPVQEIDRNSDEDSVTKYEFSFEPITEESLDFPNLDDAYILVN